MIWVSLFSPRVRVKFWCFSSCFQAFCEPPKVSRQMSTFFDDFSRRAKRVTNQKSSKLSTSFDTFRRSEREREKRERERERERERDIEREREIESDRRYRERDREREKESEEREMHREREREERERRESGTKFPAHLRIMHRGHESHDFYMDFAGEAVWNSILKNS